MSILSFITQFFDNMGEYRRLEKWSESASLQELKAKYDEECERLSEEGYWLKTNEKTPILQLLDEAIASRCNEEWEQDPRRNTDPSFRWTDENRWDD